MYPKHILPTNKNKPSHCNIFTPIPLMNAFCTPSLPLQDEEFHLARRNCGYVCLLRLHLMQLRCILQSKPKCSCCSARCCATDCPLLPSTSSIRYLVIPTCTDLFTPRSNACHQRSNASVRFMFLAYCISMAHSTYFNISAAGRIGTSPWRATEMLIAPLLILG